MTDGLSSISQELQAAPHQLEAAISTIEGMADSFTSINIIRGYAKEDMAVGVVKHELMHNITHLSTVMHGAMLTVNGRASKKSIKARVVPRVDLMKCVKRLAGVTAKPVPSMLPSSNEPTLWGAGLICFWFLLPAGEDPREAVKHVDP